jgi:hypothetical protein
MRVMIWIPDSELGGIADAAYRARKSVSRYLVDLHRGSSGVKSEPEEKKEVKVKPVTPITDWRSGRKSMPKGGK